MTKETENYSKLQDAKSRLRKSLEDIKKYDTAIGGDGEKGTFRGEVREIIDEVFSNYEDY